ncbi:Exocyst complex component 1 [Homalodisca vitripennis]|nr:Exocyst complex component 1 [Homalodisca vitripennis]
MLFNYISESESLPYVRILHQGNVPAHNFLSVKVFLAKHNISVLDHPPDLALCNDFGSIKPSQLSKEQDLGLFKRKSNRELIFKDTERRGDLDKWYIKLGTAMFEVIPSVAADHHKTPSEVVKMENFHHMFSLLSQLKISRLDSDTLKTVLFS